MDLIELKEKLVSSTKPIVSTIMKSDKTKLIAIGLNRGVTLEKHKAPGRTKLIVIKGKIIYTTVHETFEIAEFETHDIPLEEVHYVTADEPSIFLLLVA